MSGKSVLGKLFQARFRGDAELRRVIDKPKRGRRARGGTERGPNGAFRKASSPQFLTGIHNGNYFRIKLPPKQPKFPNVPKLPLPTAAPKPFVPPGGTQPLAQEIQQAAGGVHKTLPRRLLGWARANAAVLILNFGSVCTLVGFTRSDILDLRSFSMVGSLGSVMYISMQPRILWPSVIWSATFAAVNAFKIYGILQERNAHVPMSDDEEDIFVEHFMLHGVTPKQFERIMKSAKRIPVPQGQFLIRKGEPMENLFLVVKGSTRAHILGRHLTAASTDHIRKGETREGGNSGAWIGEMAFLDYYWAKQQGQESEEVSKSIYTICAHTDCEVLAWSHSDMESLMESSTDVRAALTRAMTSALVGKVVNMTISRSSKVLPNWSSWLADWRSSDGLTVRLHSVEGLPEDKRGFRLEPEQQQQQQQQQLQQQPRVA